ncbi:MAG: DAK2 domain-containing protein, partial [Gemmatimonadales bacterium]
MTVRIGYVDGPRLARSVLAAADWVAAGREEINRINVFPVPDGDTGTNLKLTVRGIVEALDASEAAGRAELAREVTRAALMAARGNSGVILSQMVRGAAESLAKTDDVTAALRSASDAAYRAVRTPVEGTMLTVIRSAAEGAWQAVEPDQGLAMVLNRAHDAAMDALRRTPEMLDILRQAGVVDAGGSGLVILLGGLRRFASGITLEIPAGEVAEAPDSASMTFLDHVELSHGGERFGYCTNFLVT